MHAHSLDRWTHEHVFLGERHERNERRVWLVVALTLAMMVAEIAGGTALGSLALVADGWHMSTHAAALTVSALAYRYARRHARDARFAFGTGRLGDLAGFASAIVLAMIALLIGHGSVTRLIEPVPIAYGQAVGIAALGLAVNVASAWLLGDDDHHHHHGHAHHHDDDHHSGIRERLEVGGDRVADLHLWRIGPGHNAAIVSIVSDEPAPVAGYKARLADLTGLSHVTIQVERCSGHP